MTDHSDKTADERAAELLPCPFCGSAQVWVGQTAEDQWAGGCIECHVTWTAAFRSELNRRPTIAAALREAAQNERTAIIAGIEAMRDGWMKEADRGPLESQGDQNDYRIMQFAAGHILAALKLGEHPESVLRAAERKVWERAIEVATKAWEREGDGDFVLFMLRAEAAALMEGGE